MLNLPSIAEVSHMHHICASCIDGLDYSGCVLTAAICRESCSEGIRDRLSGVCVLILGG